MRSECFPDLLHKRGDQMKSLLGKLGVIIVIIGFSIFVYANDEVLKSKGLCYTIENYINGLVDYTTTKCLPGTGSQKGTIGFILISSKPIFSVEASKKAWLIGVVGAVGKVMRDNPNIKVGEVYVSDTNLMKNRRAYIFPGELAKTLQLKAFDGEINLEHLYLQLNRAMKEIDIPQK